MKILGIDIGAETKDILLYDSEKDAENCIKMVLPSPTPQYASRIRKVKGDLSIDGYAIGGGSVAAYLREHIASGNAVFITEKAAFTLYNRLDRVRALGVQVVDRPPREFRGEHITLDEVNIGQLKLFLTQFDETLNDLDAVAVAVQDHGVPQKGISQNKFRLLKFKEHFESKPHLQDAVFPDTAVPEQYVRMKSTVESTKRILPNTRVFVMDSTIAAIAGCLYDCPESTKLDAVTALNVGNSHVTAAVIAEDKMLAFMEHHTGALNPDKLNDLLRKLRSGNLTDNEVFQDEGHGVFYLAKPQLREEDAVLATGPQRMMAKKSGLRIHIAAPTGDVMMTGAFGLVMSVEKALKRGPSCS